MMMIRMSAHDALSIGGPLATRATFDRPVSDSPVHQIPGRKKRHHTVARYLLDQFRDTNGKAWAYDRIEGSHRLLPPKALCIEKDLYTVADRTGNKSDVVEEFFAEIDQECAAFVKNITIDRPIIQDQDRVRAIRFIASQFIRAGQIVRGVKRAGLRIVRHEAPRMADEILADALRTGAWSLSALEEIVSFKKRVPELEVENIAANLPWLMGRIEQALMERRLDFRILVCPQGRIIISDYPIALIGTDDSYSTGGKTPGFQNAAEIWCPLSPELAMIATRIPLAPDAVLRPKLSMIKSRNRRIALDSRQWVIERPGTQVIRRLGIPKLNARLTENHDSLWPIRSKVFGERPIRATDMLN